MTQPNASEPLREADLRDAAMKAAHVIHGEFCADDFYAPHPCAAADLRAALASQPEPGLREAIIVAITPRVTKRDGSYPGQTITEVETLLPREALRRVRAALEDPR